MKANTRTETRGGKKGIVREKKEVTKARVTRSKRIGKAGRGKRG